MTIGHYNTTIPKRQIVPDPKEMYFMMHGTFIEYSRGYKWNQLLLEKSFWKISREDKYFTFWHKQTGLYRRRSLPFTDYRLSFTPVFPHLNVLRGKSRVNPTTEARGPSCVACRRVFCTLWAVDSDPCLISQQSCRPVCQRSQDRSLSGWIEFEFSSAKYPFVRNKTNK